jgi:hypothetical protein
MKSARVKLIKNNIVVGTTIPAWTQDHEAGHWADQQLEQNGHKVDHTGIVDLPEYGVDNKIRLDSSNASHTIGSMTIDNIINTPDWRHTRFYQKSKNQNRIKYNKQFMEISSVHLLDMEIDDVQLALSSAYDDVRSRLIQGDRSKEIKSGNGWVILDGYGHPNSYRFRIRNSAMKQIESLSATRDTRKQHFDGL